MNVELELLDRSATYLLPYITLAPSQNNFILIRFTLGLFQYQIMPVLPALKRLYYYLRQKITVWKLRLRSRATETGFLWILLSAWRLKNIKTRCNGIAANSKSVRNAWTISFSVEIPSSR